MIVGSVYQTKDYDIFTTLDGNRKITDQRTAKIKKSIMSRGWIRNPIVVNEKMQIIDGQGRFMVCRELGLPIEYVIAEGADIDDCIALNIGQSNWSSLDYIESYSKMGNVDYQMLLSANEIYGKKLGLQALAVTVGGHPTVGGHVTQNINTGAFKVYNPVDAERRTKFVCDCISDFSQDKGRKATWAIVMCFCYDYPKIDNRKMARNMQLYKAYLNPIATVEQALAEVEKVYNFRSHSEKVYLAQPFDEWKKKRRGG